MITELRYGLTMNREGKVFSEKAEAVYLLSEKENEAEAFESLKSFVKTGLEGKAQPVKKVKMEDVEEVIEGGKIVTKDGEVHDAATTDIEHKEDKKTTKKKTTKKKKTSKKVSKKVAAPKTVTYDRTVDAHKKELGMLLTANCPDWKATAESKAKAKGLSEHLQGEDFLDDKGDVLESFVEAIVQGMADSVENDDL